MKRNLLLIVFLIFAYYSVMAQDQLKFGLTAGLNIDNSTSKYLPSMVEGNEFSTLSESAMGVSLGILAEYRLTKGLFLMPELRYTQKGFDLTNTPQSASDSPVTIQYRLGFFEIPILLKYEFISKGNFQPYIFAGPNFGFLMNGTYETSAGSKDAKDYFDRDYAVDFGAGADFPISPYTDFFVNIRYSMGVIDAYNYSDWEDKLNGLQIHAGIKFAIFSSPKGEKAQVIEEPEIIKEIDEKAPIIEKPFIMKEFDLAEYNVPFFVSGYYRPNTVKNLGDLTKLTSGDLKQATYIERLTVNSQKYKQYYEYALTVDDIFNNVRNTSKSEIFPKFLLSSAPNQFLEISVYGYADPRTITGKYYDNPPAQFYTNGNQIITVNYGDDLDNLKLSGLRSFFSAALLDQLFAESSPEYIKLKKEGRITFKCIGAGVSTQENLLEAQRRIRIIFTKISR